MTPGLSREMEDLLVKMPKEQSVGVYPLRAHCQPEQGRRCRSSLLPAGVSSPETSVTTAPASRGELRINERTQVKSTARTWRPPGSGTSAWVVGGPGLFRVQNVNVVSCVPQEVLGKLLLFHSFLLRVKTLLALTEARLLTKSLQSKYNYLHFIVWISSEVRQLTRGHTYPFHR